MISKPIFQCVLASIVSMVALSMSVSAQATPCTIANWTGTPVGLTDANVGTQGSDHRRFSGPCGLRIPIGGSAAYLVDPSPNSEVGFHVRFYFFLDDVTGDMTLFEALAANNDTVLEAFYDHSASTINVGVKNKDGFQNLAADGLSAGWNFLEIEWRAAVASSVKVTLGHASGSTEVEGAAVDTSAFSIDAVQLGVLGAASGTTGHVDFDDYQSWRVALPDRRCLGLTVEESTRSVLSLEDVEAIFNEVASSSAPKANGQPDFDGNGEITSADVAGVFNRVAAFQADCAANR